MKKNLSLINGNLKTLFQFMTEGYLMVMVSLKLCYGIALKIKKKVNFGVEFWLRHLRRIKDGCKLMQINFPSDDEIIETTKHNFESFV